MQVSAYVKLIHWWSSLVGKQIVNLFKKMTSYQSTDVNYVYLYQPFW